MLISVFVSSSDTHSERRFDTSLTVAQLKDKLMPITGIAPQYQALSLVSSDSSASGSAPQPLVTLSDEARTLAGYGIEPYQTIRVVNLDPTARPGEFSDVSQVDKFELTADEYAARPDTVLAHLKAHKLGRFADAPEKSKIAHDPPTRTSVPDGMAVGARCEVGGEGAMAKRGTVRIVGEAEMGKGGVWVGVELDEPTGKGDGSVDGKRYFQCRAKHAVFVRPDKVTVGDFPEEDLLASDDEEI